MTSSPSPSEPSGADLSGSASGSVDSQTQGTTPAGPPAATAEIDDPIFHAAESVEQTPRTVRLLWQFFFFPLLIVAACLLPIVAILATRGGAPQPKELLEQVLTGSANQQKQAAQQLAYEIARARTQADRALRGGKLPEEPPFFLEPSFAEGLRHAFRLARSERQSEERQAWLAQALGRAGDPEAVPLLRDVLYPTGTAAGGSGAPVSPAPGGPIPSDVRRAAALGLLFMESRVAESALLEASGDREDGEVRAIAMNGLALLGRLPGADREGPAVREALARGLTDTHNGVRLNAAFGLALRGDAAGLDLLDRALSRGELEKLDVREPTLQTHAMVNAVRSVVALSVRPALAPGEGTPTPIDPLLERLESSRQRIATLAESDGDENVRHIAREGLERWRKN